MRTSLFSSALSQNVRLHSKNYNFYDNDNGLFPNVEALCRTVNNMLTGILHPMPNPLFPSQPEYDGIVINLNNEMTLDKVVSGSCFHGDGNKKMKAFKFISDSVVNFTQGMFSNMNPETIIVNAPNLTISDGAFDDNSIIHEIQAVNAKFTKNAFRGCKNLSILNFTGNNVIAEEGAFVDLPNISEFTIQPSWSNFDYKAFINCSNLRTIVNLRHDPGNAYISSLENLTNLDENIDKMVVLSKDVSISKIGEALKNHPVKKLELFLSDSPLGADCLTDLSIEELDMTMSTIDSFHTGAIKNIPNLKTIHFPMHQDAITISPGAFENIGITDFKVTTNLTIKEGSFKNCRNLKNIAIADGFKTFSLSWFKSCDIDNVTVENENDFVLFRGYIYEVAPPGTARSLLEVEHKLKPRGSMLWVPSNMTLVPIDTSYDPYSFSYVKEKFNINYVENESTGDVNPNEFDQYCNTSNNRIDKVYFPTNSTLNSDYDKNRYDCNEWSCKLNCNGTETNTEENTTTPIETETGTETETATETATPTNVRYTNTTTITRTYVQNETTTSSSYVTVVQTISEGDNETSYSYQVAYQIVRTLFYQPTDTVYVFLIEAPTETPSRNRLPNYSAATVILLSTFGIICIFCIAIMGMFFYKKYKEVSLSDSNQYEEIEDPSEIGRVIDAEELKEITEKLNELDESNDSFSNHYDSKGEGLDNADENSQESDL